MTPFKRGLKPDFIDELAKLADREGWWREVVRDRDLVIGIRQNYLNVYWRGQSLFKVSMEGGAVTATTHPKYLLNPALSGAVAFDPATGTFAPLDEDAITRTWEPGVTLKRLKKAAALYAGEEKMGVQAVVQADNAVIDVEIAVPARMATKDELPRSAAAKGMVPRLDLVRLEQRNGAGYLVFWEAKCLFNPELNLAAKKNVKTQIDAYRMAVDALRSSIIASYAVVAGNLKRIAEMSGGIRTVAPVVRDAAAGAIAMASPPEINLMVFGYDSHQKEGLWTALQPELQGALGPSRVEGKGDPRGLRLDPPRGAAKASSFGAVVGT